MLQRMYSIRDAAAENYYPPFFKGTHGEAERDFKTLVNDPKSTLFKYPQHFELYYLGDYESTTGAISPVYPPQYIIKAVEVLEKEHPTLQPVN